jgi:hypothetical protein
MYRNVILSILLPEQLAVWLKMTPCVLLVLMLSRLLSHVLPMHLPINDIETYPNRTIFVKGSGRTVYVLDSKGFRHSIPDWDTFLQLHGSNEDIIILEDNQLEQYREGSPVETDVVPMYQQVSCCCPKFCAKLR